MNQFERNKVWTLVPKPYGKTIIGLKWVFRNKIDEEEIVTKNKARLVAKGYKQEEGIDYDKMFAPVAGLEAIGIFLAYASYMRFTVYHMDVKSAFLNGKISEVMYVEQPYGFESSEFPNHVFKSNKALYGLKQDPRARGISICQEKYVNDLLKKYDLADCASVKGPILPLNNLGPDESGVSVNETQFRGMIMHCSDSLLLTPLCCADIHEVTSRVSALAGCDRLVSEPLVIEKLAMGRAHAHEPTLSRIRAPVDSETAIVVNGSKAREREDKILAEAEKEEEKEKRTATITSLDELQLRPFMNEGIERPAKGSTAEFQDYETKSWD
ncbi:retrovirus-related pol polyprotein from transposon TNT 1-94 [Tanacetum coccineum]